MVTGFWTKSVVFTITVVRGWNERHSAEAWYKMFFCVLTSETPTCEKPLTCGRFSGSLTGQNHSFSELGHVRKNMTLCINTSCRFGSSLYQFTLNGHFYRVSYRRIFLCIFIWCNFVLFYHRTITNTFCGCNRTIVIDIIFLLGLIGI